MGDRRANIAAALAALRATPLVEVVAVSSLHETVAHTPSGPDERAPAFLNAAATLRTTLSARALLRALLEIERALGRDRSSEARWGPRTIDLDLLLYADSVLDEPGLQVPHPRMHQRRFVLAPLAEIAPRARHPVFGRTAAELLDSLDDRPAGVP